MSVNNPFHKNPLILIPADELNKMRRNNVRFFNIDVDFQISASGSVIESR